MKMKPKRAESKGEYFPGANDVFLVKPLRREFHYEHSVYASDCPRCGDRSPSKDEVNGSDYSCFKCGYRWNEEFRRATDQAAAQRERDEKLKKLDREWRKKNHVK